MAKKWADIRQKRFTKAERDQIDRRVDEEIREMNLSELRRELGVTQEDLARAAETSQSELSRTERREDHLLSTLRAYVKALGGEIEVTAVVGDKRVRLVGV